jgi:hypothetical protein
MPNHVDQIVQQGREGIGMVRFMGRLGCNLALRDELDLCSEHLISTKRQGKVHTGTYWYGRVDSVGKG